MYCGNCGHPNEDGAKFCENCGSRLDNDSNNKLENNQEDTQKLRAVRDNQEKSDNYYKNERLDNQKSQEYKTQNQENQKTYTKDNKSSSSFDIKKILLIALLVICLLGLIGAAVFNFLPTDKEKSTDIVTSDQLSNDGSSQDKDETRDFESDLSRAKSLIDSGDYEGAINILKTIPENEKEGYEKAQNLLGQAEEKIVDQLVEVFNSGDYEKAEKLSSRYMELLPKSNDIAVVNDRSKEELKKAEKENNKEKTVEERKSELSKNYDMDNIIYNDQWDKNGNPSYVEFYKPEDFIGKDLTVDISAGQLKEAPDINSARIGQVERGEVVHPTKAQSDGTRYWLYIGKGWVSSKLITGEFHKE